MIPNSSQEALLLGLARNEIERMIKHSLNVHNLIPSFLCALRLFYVSEMCLIKEKDHEVDIGKE